MPVAVVRDEGGVILILSAMTMVVVITLAVLAINTNYAADVRAQLQAAADAAAFAGASRLNSAKDGWSAARHLSVHTLGEHTALSSVGADVSLDVDASSTNDLWDFSVDRNLVVEIQRGNWRNGAFQSMEGDWELNNPGMPREVLANAVRVRVSRPKTRIITPPMAGAIDTYRLEGAAIALRGPVDPVCAAPFAIPVCSVVDGSGDFMGGDICKGDRLIAPTDRYCRPGHPAYPNCGDVPSSPFTGGCQNGKADPRPGDGLFDKKSCAHSHGQNGLSCRMWGWKDRHYYGSNADHYGVVGLPGYDPDRRVDEAVLNLFRDGANTKKCVTTALGDAFQVLGPGLTTPEADALIWEKVKNSGLPAGDSSEYRPMSKTELGSLARSLDYVDVPNPVFYASCGVDRTWNGICNSHRGSFVPSTGRGINSQIFRLYGESNPGAETITDDTPVWVVKVPIIAEPGPAASRCQGAGSSFDPGIDPAKQYVVVGFADMLVYDVDIGSPPPEGLPAADLAFREPCNNVRARVSCETTFVPTSATGGFERARLVL